MTADPTSSHPSPAGLAAWYADRAPAVPEPGAVILTGPTGEPVTYYRRSSERPTPAMSWPMRRSRHSPPRIP